jgi:hypothetical protein
MSSFGVFDLATGELVLPFTASDSSQVQIQAPPGSGRVVLEGDYSTGRWQLSADGSPEAMPHPRSVTAAQVKFVARKRIEATEWMLHRHRSETELGQPTSITHADYLAVMVEHAQIRAASGAIEQMTPIPEDFWQDHYWSAS